MLDSMKSIIKIIVKNVFLKKNPIERSFYLNYAGAKVMYMISMYL